MEVNTMNSISFIYPDWKSLQPETTELIERYLAGENDVLDDVKVVDIDDGTVKGMYELAATA